MYAVLQKGGVRCWEQRVCVCLYVCVCAMGVSEGVDSEIRKRERERCVGEDMVFEILKCAIARREIT